MIDLKRAFKSVAQPIFVVRSPERAIFVSSLVSYDSNHVSFNLEDKTKNYDLVNLPIYSIYALSGKYREFFDKSGPKVHVLDTDPGMYLWKSVVRTVSCLEIVGKMTIVSEILSMDEGQINNPALVWQDGQAYSF